MHMIRLLNKLTLGFMTWYIIYKIWNNHMIKSTCMDVSNRLHLLLIWVQNSIPECGSMIITTERHDKDDPYWLLAVAYTSDLYEKFTQSSDLIDLLESASSREDLLLSWSGSLVQISEIFLEVEDRLLEEMKRWKKDGEEIIFSLIFLFFQTLRYKP